MSLNIKTKFLRCTGYFYSIKKPYKANSSSCTTTYLSKLLTSCLTAVKNMLLSTVKRYMKEPVRIYFGLLKVQVVMFFNYLIVSIPDLCNLTYINAWYFNATSLSTYYFSSLYTTLLII